ncbi:MAG: hypothetical protein MRERV_4c010 [Mycoplasmataceae bacterium RV_VA103A]|nr:MAG: hypothetical protein MRERV_23c008 [Mycoplasmataceae bacterium RV_VA103A]KLL05135.1 MAG: hypothetical protein MRERV_4c010 [Mycoplasmataceae bacterium RV_VA103A]
MKIITKTLSTSKEYTRLSMKIFRARQSGKSQEVISQLLIERERIRLGKHNNFSFSEENNITEKYSARQTRNIAKPQIIVGTSDFKKLRLNNAIIVDKSLLIKAILEAPSEVSLIARPRRWGKSLNLDMLKTFFEIETDVQGEPLSVKKKKNRKLFADLKINDDKYAMARQGNIQ